MTFPAFLRAQVERIGNGSTRVGELRAAIALGVSDRTVRLWTAGGGKPPLGMVAGAQLLLPQIEPVSAKAIEYLTAPPPPKQKPRKSRAPQ